MLHRCECKSPSNHRNRETRQQANDLHNFRSKWQARKIHWSATALKLSEVTILCSFGYRHGNAITSGRIPTPNSSRIIFITRQQISIRNGLGNIENNEPKALTWLPNSPDPNPASIYCIRCNGTKGSNTNVAVTDTTGILRSPLSMSGHVTAIWAARERPIQFYVGE